MTDFHFLAAAFLHLAIPSAVFGVFITPVPSISTRISA
jgi:hypothetical protein